MDGAAAALAAWLKFGDEAEYRPASYGDPAPTDDEVRGRDVFVLDFSYPRAELERIYDAIDGVWPALNYAGERKGKLVVLDHHKTAQADLVGLPFCTFDMNKSGAVLAWEHFHRDYSNRDSLDSLPHALPELFDYVQDRDLWRWELPYSREISAALAASGALQDFRVLVPIYEDWGHASAGWKRSLIDHGGAILRAEAQMIERAVATAEEVELEIPPLRMVGGPRIRALAVSTMSLQSEIGEALALESARRGRDAVGVVYYKDGPSGRWRVSLRSRDVADECKPAMGGPCGKGTSGCAVAHPMAPDVSVIAKSFGGGGHHRAAGFEVDRLPWDVR
jgi:uncharacterized protein